jgi:hypothetical protein
MVLAAKSEFSSEQLAPGVVTPSSIPFAFKCPYFISTLFAWLLANAAVMQLIARDWLPHLDQDFGRFVYACYVLLCALPMVILSIFMVSSMRGEVNRMWMHVECWTMEPGEELRNGEDLQELVDVKDLLRYFEHKSHHSRSMER